MKCVKFRRGLSRLTVLLPPNCHPHQGDLQDTPAALARPALSSPPNWQTRVVSLIKISLSTKSSPTNVASNWMSRMLNKCSTFLTLRLAGDRPRATQPLAKKELAVQKSAEEADETICIELNIDKMSNFTTTVQFLTISK